MSGPKLKLFGNLSLDGIKKAMKIPSKLGEYKGEKQLKVTAAQWDDDGINLQVWDADKNEAIRIGNLHVSTLDGAPKPQEKSDSEEEDLPF